jgi:dethiobiotin synthetase
MKSYFITGIGTGVGKTIVSAILTEAFQADYWKPVQCGVAEGTDTEKVRSLVSNPVSKFHKEAYCFSAPMSPHAAAKLEDTEIDITKIAIPATNKTLIIEGAGGLMVPLTYDFLMIDLIALMQTPVLLVSMNYLGSINHTLLSVEALKARHIPVSGIIFNGAENTETESIIAKYSGYKILPRIHPELHWNKALVTSYARTFKTIL